MPRHRLRPGAGRRELVTVTADGAGNKLRYTIEDGIPLLLPPELLPAAAAAPADQHDAAPQPRRRIARPAPRRGIAAPKRRRHPSGCPRHRMTARSCSDPESPSSRHAMPPATTKDSHDFRLQDCGHFPGRGGPPPDPPRRARDARTHVPARGVRRQPAAQGRPDRRIPAHDRPDRGADRDPHRPRRRGPLGLLQHLLHPGRSRRRRRGRQRHRRGPPGRPGLRLEGRDAGGILVDRRSRSSPGRAPTPTRSWART